MTRIMKLTFSAAAIALLSATASAQTVNATVGMTATVNAALAATTANALAFGTVTQGGASTVISPQTSSAGRVNITGTANQGITMTVTGAATLTSGAATLGVTSYQYCYLQNATSQSSCTVTAVPAGNITGNSLSSSGNGYLFVGATLAAPSGSQTPGAYAGNIAVTITSP